MTGYLKEELLKMKTKDVLTQEFKQTGFDKLEQLVFEGVSSGEVKVRRKDNSIFDAAFEIVKINDSTFLGFCKDVTAYRSAINQLKEHERQLLENKKILQKSNSELNAVFEAFPGIIQILDREFNIINASESLIKTFGYSSIDDVRGKKCFEMWKKVGRSCPECEVAEVLQNGKTKIRICTAKEAEVTGMWFNSYISPIKDHNGMITGAIECMMDITELKRTQDALRDNETKMKKIIENTSEGVVEINKDFKITSVNRKVLNSLGYTKEEYIGHSITMFVFTEDLPEISKQMQQRVEGKGARYKVRLKTKNGSPYWCIAISTPIMDESKNFKGSFIVFIDINDREKQKQTNSKEQAGCRTAVN
jgi:PAS domain S-box-containing protein